MARLRRLSAVGMPQHVIQRGNNRQACFCGEQDLAAYAYWLKEFSRRFQVQVHSWVFMTNHVHLLVTPMQQNGVSSMMQALGRQYVRYFNYTYRRSGTLWEGRFKSCLVQTNSYLLKCYRYIELNPVRASMVKDPGDYSWSSYQCNGLGKYSELCTPHEEYLALGGGTEERCKVYRELFSSYVDEKLVCDIRDAVNKGMALGDDCFKEEIEHHYQRRVKPKLVGRPKLKLSR